jgi:hypothetical protein
MLLAVAAACAGLTGSFKGVPNSAGAGNIVFALRVHNGGTAPCTLPGPPRVKLVGAPTHVVPDPRYKPKALVLQPGKTAVAMARFSPDVPGVGEPVSGTSCEPLAKEMIVRAVGRPFLVKITPPTRVCEHGRMTFTPFR